MRRFLLIVLPITFLLLTSVSTEETNVAFYSGSLADLESKAKVANKPYILDFYTVWCGPCKNMEKYTFTNPELAKYIKDNYLAFKVDGESIMGDGAEVAMKYDVRFYPTLLIFSPQGAVVKRLSGFQSAESLLQELKKYRGTQETPVVNTTPAAQGTLPTPLPNANSGEGFYKMSISRQEKSGFGVQIAVYGDYANVIKEAQKLDETFHRNVMVNITKSADKPVFKIVLGPFDTKQQAESYLSEIKGKEGRSGMIVDLGKAIAASMPAAAGERGISNATSRLKR